ncbi:hypothetical protein HHL22_04370 [Hymenobacter sp. RP-2-7]|uniref:Putative beta-lactamase-inhibitor-like PepSY-like domain-containing protein n=1 Tax=Hymenobacter polaris TaxID=2682546 RepID=A0A7Y0ABP0_9BACT|nr:PepSY-like domain-containing protein [Hymenobacter polaris]NML64434.1 hypothetical protein [Hymenobacter polaris]
MQKLLISAALLVLAAGAAQAQKMTAAQVPAATKAAFKTKFPTVQRNTWEKEGPAYEAGFSMNGKTMSAVITADGKLQETETDMTSAQLPAAVRTTLARDYKAYQVHEAATIVRADGTTVYEAKVAKGGKKQDVLFTTNGKVAPK